MNNLFQGTLVPGNNWHPLLEFHLLLPQEVGGRSIQVLFSCCVLAMNSYHLPEPTYYPTSYTQYELTLVLVFTCEIIFKSNFLNI